jgi:hypothetical protein
VVVAVIAAAVVLSVAGVLGYKFFLAGKSDEDQIRALVQNVTAAQNNADGPGLLKLDCAYAQARNPATSQMLRNDLNDQGAVATSVADVRVSGDHATAAVTTTRSKYPNEKATETWSFVKENGSWKWCGRQ